MKHLQVVRLGFDALLGEVRDATPYFRRVATTNYPGVAALAHGSASHGGDRTDTSPTLQTSGQTSPQEGGGEEVTWQKVRRKGTKTKYSAATLLGFF